MQSNTTVGVPTNTSYELFIQTNGRLVGIGNTLQSQNIGIRAQNI